MSGYEGQTAIIQLGQVGLFTDAAQTNIPSSALIRANNVTYYNNILQKDYGSRIWNSTPCPAGVVRAHEMFVDNQSQLQRVFALCKNGQIYKFSNYFTQTAITAGTGAPATLTLPGYNCMTVGGNEVQGNPKKLFTFTGYNSPQVIAADATVRNNIALPAADWTGTSQPFGGIVHGQRMWAWGNTGNPHTLYASNVENHEDFSTNGAYLVFTIYPGESDGIVCCCVFRGRLYIFKYPLGVYYLDDSDPNPTNWTVQKLDDQFGACSPQSACVANNDLVVANNYGSLSSLQASLVFGDVLSSDVFYQLGCYRFADQEIRKDLVTQRSMVFFGKKRQLLASFQSNVGSEPDRIAVIDYRNANINANSPPKVAWVNKDQPNCLFTIRNQQRVPMPFYGANDGNLYQMDVSDHWVGSATDTTEQTAYLFDAQTPFMDFSQGDALIGHQVKTFEFLEIQYEPTGNFNCSIDVYLDCRLQGTFLCDLSGRSNLSELDLNSTLIDGGGPFYRRFPIQGEGRSISLRFYNDGLGQDVRLVKAIVYYRISGQQQTVG